MLVKNLSTGAVWAVKEAHALLLLRGGGYAAVRTPNVAPQEKTEAAKPSRSRTKPKAESGE